MMNFLGVCSEALDRQPLIQQAGMTSQLFRAFIQQRVKKEPDGQYRYETDIFQIESG